MGRSQNTQHRHGRIDQKPTANREMLLQLRRWWIMVPLAALVVFGCQKGIIESISDSDGSENVTREEYTSEEAFRVQDADPWEVASLDLDDTDGDNEDVIILRELPDWPTRYFEMNEARIREDQLILSISYPGGSRNHDFKLVSTIFQESMPVQVTAQLFHFADDERMDRQTTKELVFDLTPLKELYYRLYRRPRGEIIINMVDLFAANEAAPLIYEFSNNPVLPPEPPLPPIVVHEDW